MAHYTLIARVNAADGKFPFVNVQFSKNHRPIPIERAAYYYLRQSSSGKHTPIKIGKDVAVAHTALIRMEDGQPLFLIGTGFRIGEAAVAEWTEEALPRLPRVLRHSAASSRG
jgi:hypothetical protein